MASMAFSVALSVSMQLAVVHGYGEHKADLAPSQLHAALRWFYIEQSQYKMVICLNKVAVILLYKRIFVGKVFQIVCWGAIGVIISWTIASIAATIFQCTPVEAAWNKTIPGATCINTTSFWMAYAITNILSDVLVLAMPIPEIFRLQLNLKQKIGLSGLFLLGGLCVSTFPRPARHCTGLTFRSVVLCSIMRIFAVVHDDKSKDTYASVYTPPRCVLLTATSTFDFIPRNIWSLIEANVGIICACLPILKHPFTRALSLVLGTTQRSSTNPYGHGISYELRDDSQQKSGAGSRRHTNDRLQSSTRSGRHPWDGPDADGDSDEVHIIADSARKAGRGDEIHFGFGDERIHVRKEFEIIEHTV
ncbi:hypothetical protein LTR36_007376 [Oleoguttula mirabilis]|uniref:Rhodopsin domain-containing protein n=1 Tax=Oleoguttula mirabilis TaxID=1507867 RepID=A0AAV9JA25_9PEZI|nr:hypothetical protein LTR36_007376 [Oleoguttula mirabilis]